MPQYLSPGVYIEEQDSGPEPIEGVSTSVTGFVGVTQMGPMDKNPPVLITSFPEFQRTFGTYFTPSFYTGTAQADTYNLLPHAVAGFFNNGGQLLYIKRAWSAASPPVTAAVNDLENNVTPGPPTIMTTLSSTAAPGANIIYLESLLGIQNGSQITLTQTKNGVTSTSGALTVDEYSDADGAVSLSEPLPAPNPSAANYDWQYTTVAVTLHGAFTPANNTAQFALQAATPGAWGNTVQAQGGTGLQVEITPSSRAQAQVIAPVGNAAPYTDNLIQLNSASNFYVGAIVEFDTGGVYQVPGNFTGVFSVGQQVQQVTQDASATLFGTVTGSSPMYIGPQTALVGGGPDAWDAWTGQTSKAVYTPTVAPAAMYAVLGSVTSGVFVPGEQVVQKNTGATANLVGNVAGLKAMIIGPQTGSAADPLDIWTGQLSGAVYTPSSTATVGPVQVFGVNGTLGSGTPQFQVGETVNQVGGAIAILVAVVGTLPSPSNVMWICTLTGSAPTDNGKWTGASSTQTFAPNGLASGLPAPMYVVTGQVTSGTFTADEEVIQSSVSTATVLGPIPSAAGQPLMLGSVGGDAPATTGTWALPSGAASPSFAQTSAVIPLGKFYGKVASISGNSIQLVPQPLQTYALNSSATQNQVGAIASGLTASPPTVAVRTCEFNINDSYGTVTESFTGLTLDNTTPYYYATTINNNSTLLSVPNVPTVPPAPPFDNTTLDPSTMPISPNGESVQMTGGTDGAAPLSSDFVGNDGGPGNRTGIAALIDASEVSIIGAPGITDQTTQMALIDQCQNLLYRFAILDPAPTPSGGPPTMTTIQAQRDLYDTEYAAIYFPRVVVTDPLSGNPLAIPPSGHMAGIYAQTDNSRGVWKAPANIVISGILSLETKLSKGDQDILNPEPNNINALRDFTAQGRGLRVYGARCITSDTEWMYINVRRLFIFLEASLDEGTQWAVFEPNDQTLWNRLIQSVSAFLTTIWQQGGLMGATADQAFFVKCGYDTMSSDDIENGRLIMLVGVAPVFPAEFVIIRIGQWAGGSSVQEL
jgi:phage tail sheath protein FI